MANQTDQVLCKIQDFDRLARALEEIVQAQ